MKSCLFSLHSEKKDEKEAKKIRHFLQPIPWGKGYPDDPWQKCWPNRECMKTAIALYQKLSLIYPLKALILRQNWTLKASLPWYFRYNPVTGLWFTSLIILVRIQKVVALQEMWRVSATSLWRKQTTDVLEKGTWILGYCRGFCFVYFQPYSFPKLHPTK